MVLVSYHLTWFSIWCVSYFFTLVKSNIYMIFFIFFFDIKIKMYLVLAIVNRYKSHIFRGKRYDISLLPSQVVLNLECQIFNQSNKVKCIYDIFLYFFLYFFIYFCMWLYNSHPIVSTNVLSVIRPVFGFIFDLSGSKFLLFCNFLSVLS